MVNNRLLINTSIGLVPEDWVIVRLGDICVFPTQSISTKSFEHRFYVGTDNMLQNCKGVIPFNGILNYPNVREYKKGDVLLSNIRPYLQKIWLAEVSAGCSTDVLVLRPKSYVLPEYLYCLLSKPSFFNYVMEATIGTKMPRGDKKRIKDYLIAIPKEQKEQEKIINTLSSFDSLIKSIDEQILKKQKIKEGLMQSLLSGSVRLPGFSEKWEKVELGDILSYEQPGPYLVHSTDYVDTGIPVLTAGKTFILGYTNERFGVYDNLPVIIFDDFVTESKYVDFPFKAKSGAMKMLKVRDNSRHNIRFIYEKMQKIVFPMTDHKRYWIAEYSHLKITIPSTIEEENVIASSLASMDNEIEQLKVKRDKYALIKEGMMQELLTGKTRLV